MVLQAGRGAGPRGDWTGDWGPCGSGATGALLAQHLPQVRPELDLLLRIMRIEAWGSL